MSAKLTPCTIFGAFVAVMFTLWGNATTVVALNWWLLTFPSTASGPFAVQVFSGLLYFGCFFVCLIVAAVIWGIKPLMHVTFGTEGGTKPKFRRLWIVALMGLTDLASNLPVIFATPHVPEILQAFLETTVTPWALLLTYIFVKGERSKHYRSPFLLFSLLLTAGGGLTSAIPPKAHISIAGKYTENIPSLVGWIGVYAATAIVYGGWCVLQRLYCDGAPIPPTGSRPSSIVAWPGHVQAIEEQTAKSGEVDDEERLSLLVQRAGAMNGKEKWIPYAGLNKLVMLFGDTLFQLLFTFAFLPLDALPWFGTSPNIQSTWSRFTAGMECIATCPGSLKYCLLYSFGYVVSYIGSAYLNHVSPTLSSMFIELSAPSCAVLLLIVPSWNVAAGSGSVLWYQQSAAAVMISAATVLYYLWERKEEEREALEARMEERVESTVQDVANPATL